MTGDLRTINGTEYVEINDNGTLEKLPHMSYFKRLRLYLIQRFKPMGLEDLRKWTMEK